MNGASQSADVGVYSEVPPETPEARPVVSLFEHWEEGAHLPVALKCKGLRIPYFTCDTILLDPSTTSIELTRCRQPRVNTQREEVMGTSITHQAGTRGELSKSTQKHSGFPLE